MEDKPGVIFPEGLSSYLRLSRSDALHLVKGMLSETLEARGGRIRVTEHVYPKGLNGPEIMYWIG